MNKRLWLAGLSLALCLAGCGGQAQQTAQEPAQDDVQAEQAADSAPQVRTGYADTALVGNSQVDSFFIYNLLPDAACYYRVGVNVNSVFEQPMVQGEDTETPVIDLLEGKDFSHIVFFFGENELGWSNRSAFTTDYAKVIQTARSYCPEATIYLSAIPPVSAEASARNENNVSNASIQSCNQEIQQIAQQNDAVYIDAYTALADESGCLPADAAADGIHPAKEYTDKWADLIKQSIAEAEKE